MGTTAPNAAGTPAKWPAWKTGAATIGTFVALLYLIELVDQLTGHALDDNGIRPLESDGLKGVIFAPLLHANWGHLAANTVPALVLALNDADATVRAMAAYSLGKSGVITKAQHCRAKVWLTGFGWVPVDPAEETGCESCQ